MCSSDLVGGPLALVREGDVIALDVAARSITLQVPVQELDRRHDEWTKLNMAKPATLRYNRSYAALYQQHVTQADEGADFDFLQGNEPLPEPTIF